MGKILDELQKLGIDDNTLVIYTADNGFNCGHHGIWGKGNGTFPMNMYDTSIKVPLIIWHPDRIREKTVIRNMLSAYDIKPTLLEYVGIEQTEDETLPGSSFLDVLEGNGQDQGGEDMVVVFDEYGPVRMIRTETDKYICRYPYGLNELYDLLNDPHEYNNLLKDSNIDTDKIETHMRKELEEWFFKYVDPKIDGAKESVFGCGQIGLAGLYGNGKSAYNCDEYLKEHKNYSLYNDSF